MSLLRIEVLLGHLLRISEIYQTKLTCRATKLAPLLPTNVFVEIIFWINSAQIRRMKLLQNNTLNSLYSV